MTSPKVRPERKRFPTAAHWGHYLIEVEDQAVVEVVGYEEDKEVSRIGRSFLETANDKFRIDQPMIRKGFYEKGLRSEGKNRGKEPFVAVSWNHALDLAAEVIATVKSKFGNEAIYAGSYGWSSAGSFHKSQRHLHRFLNLFGGYTRSETSYSVAAGEVLLPHVLGSSLYTLLLHAVPWKDVLEHGELVVCFGGINPKNLQVAMGGVGAHTALDQLKDSRAAELEIVNISPIRSDLPAFLDAEWIPLRPTTDTAVLLALCHTLVVEGLHDEQFLEQYCVGFERFEPYLMGKVDGRVKDADWAETVSAVSAKTIRSLARRMASKRTFIPMSWSLQRAEHGEQPYWTGIVLMALLGQIGLPGAGIGHGVGSIHPISFRGRQISPFHWAVFEEGDNPVDSVIPVARISDMLLHPGERFDYNGKSLAYPEIQLVYWAGGNPFHHHQDLNRLREAWSHPSAVFVNEPFWTSTARHADIVFPITTTLERNDLSFNTFDPYVTPMPRAVPPFAKSRNDFDVFRELSRRLGFEEEFTEGRSEMEWVRHLYDRSCDRAAKYNIELPDFATFWKGRHFSMEDQFEELELLLEKFRTDPKRDPLGTPSGKIEIHSRTIERFRYEDCPGHPVWLEKTECLGTHRAERFPMHLLSGQPGVRLHSQFDYASVSQDSKIQGREPATMHPLDAEERGIPEGSVVRIYNDRGACLAGVRFSDEVFRHVIQLATGAWYDPIETSDGLGLDVHGNPNVLTRDVGTSKLAQGSTAHSCLVEVELYQGDVPKLSVRTPPDIIRST